MDRIAIRRLVLRHSVKLVAVTLPQDHPLSKRVELQRLSLFNQLREHSLVVAVLVEAAAWVAAVAAWVKLALTRSARSTGIKT
jgi:hypothetical protein